MGVLWLTYAWKDNENADVDHIIAELKKTGLGVKYDRVQLLAGRRLWDQIDKGIADPAVCDAWAIFVSKDSLRSEPCQEELAYALDRGLRTRNFPLIGIFPEPIDRTLVPSAIATRLYVTLQDPQWAQRVADAVSGNSTVTDATPPHPYHVKLHKDGGGIVLEVRPRSGRWYPFMTAVSSAERAGLRLVGYGPYGELPGALMVSQNDFELTDNRSGQKLAGIRIHHEINNLQAGFIYLSDPTPSVIYFGQLDQMYELKRR